MTAYLTWPTGVLPAQNETWSPIGGASTGGATLGGISQTTESTGGPCWRAEFDILVHSEDGHSSWDAIEGLLDNGVTGIIVPRGRNRVRSVFRSQTVAHDDGALFSDDSLYSSGIFGELDAAALRATTVKITMTDATPQAGDHFTVVHETAGARMYRIVQGLGGDDFKIRPPLREAIDAATQADFSNPRCVMKLADPNGMRLTVGVDETGVGTPVFIEAFGVEALAE